MKEVRVLVTLQVDNDGDEPDSPARCAAVQAVANALSQVEGMGFSHDTLPDASVGVVDVEPVGGI